MKKIALSFCLFTYFLASFAQEKDPVIMSIAGQEVYKSEFEYIWNKNKTTDRKSLDEYVDMFVNFKLKVAEAKAQGIDTTQSFIEELKGYRSKLITPYLNNKETEETIYKEAYDRSKQYVEASHILLMLNQNALPEDTLIVYNKAMKLYDRAIKGEDFAKLARENSQDGSKADGGYLGFATGLRYVYPFENAVFNTPIGKISKPFRTQYGYHIVKVHSRRPGMGQYRSGHILKLVQANATPIEKQAAKDSIFKIYTALKNGGEFQTYATKNSDDQTAASNKGEYGLMLCGSLPIEYEDAIYKLKVGEFSAPFQSKYGWHIVKALEFQPYPDFEKSKDLISKVVNRGDRAGLINDSKIEKLKKEYHYTFDEKNLEPLAKALDVLKTSNDSLLLKALSKSESVLFTLDGLNYTQKQFLSSTSLQNIQNTNLKKAFDAFVKQAVMSHEDSRLEKKYPELGLLMQEYKEGILLFEVSNREVWEKASLDTLGLKSYFETNKGKYDWDKPRYKGYVIQCANPRVAKQVKKMIQQIPADSIPVILNWTFNNDSTTLIKVDSGLFAQGEDTQVDFLAFKMGKKKSPVDFPDVFLKGKVLSKGPESYTDVRGLVVSDYQNYLETKWIQSLKDKFKVIVHKDVVNTVNKN